MWTSTTGFSINVLMLDHKLRQRLHYSFDSDFHVRPGYIIAFRKELISWKQKSELGDKIAIFVRTTNGSIHYISNMKLLEIKKKNRKYLWVFLFQKMYLKYILLEYSYWANRLMKCASQKLNSWFTFSCCLLLFYKDTTAKV